MRTHVDDGHPSAAQPIFHLAEEAAWVAATASGSYRADSLADEGFIHCSTGDQLPRVAAFLYAGRTDLMRLTLRPSTLKVVWEDTAGAGEDFPHVYGEIPLDAVVVAEAVAIDASGRITAR